jgi:hypothetical protein
MSSGNFVNIKQNSYFTRLNINSEATKDFSTKLPGGTVQRYCSTNCCNLLLGWNTAYDAMQRLSKNGAGLGDLQQFGKAVQAERPLEYCIIERAQI